ncbi:dihydrofolate reductase family protein [Nocardia blacklockiae]|uniref:dihydrofolate reductase family protein n=1 Tax=Nocardia blacklockiae TaxID=480036 RepID=UPI0018931DCE|nr:dihydrofolate reductase family protein [Nocardia blacklockiae]MBF6171798.1 dihydrofolate reductase [Nocardia blacklockiae]
MPHTTYYTATTLDGFIATTDHSLDWLLTRDNDSDGPMGYEAFIKDIGAICMGASTYQWILDSGEAWVYDMPAWVFTHRTFPARTDADVRFTQAPVPEVYEEMAKAAGDKNLWVVGGGDLAGQFADHNLLDEVCVSIAPVTLGSGAPLLPRHVELKLTELAPNGEFACARYAVVRP